MNKFLASTAALALLCGIAAAKPGAAKPGNAKPVGGKPITMGSGNHRPVVNAGKPFQPTKPIVNPVKPVLPSKPIVSQPFPKPGHLPSNHVNYHKHHGKAFGNGWCYQGQHHNHWSYSCYWPKYNCQAYWCPATTCYYYWCPTACCYYPVSHIAQAAPLQVAPVIQNGPPVGIPSLPQ